MAYDYDWVRVCRLSDVTMTQLAKGTSFEFLCCLRTGHPHFVSPPSYYEHFQLTTKHNYTGTEPKN